MKVDEREYYEYLREIVETLKDPHKKQLRYNEIVECAKLFYPTDVFRGIYELTKACDREEGDLYDRNPMWKSLMEDYKWMLA